MSPEELHCLQLQDLVAARVGLETAATRAQLADREKQRTQQTLAESHERVRELEARLARISAELAASRAEMVDLQHAAEVRLEVGCWGPGSAFLRCNIFCKMSPFRGGGYCSK